ncbi:TetR family transcriptional regulator [Streptomyces sp. ME02-8801-2C]|uniref:TetR/AcrR family transcriptional regulator n=1 Tax=Streptomyces sp. ME02-8801-2C TaxID=3028680 RepID=UPI0029AE042F|nr:TetR family transcriptional regulator [Streptomyces sp. ME02-8801-2C]MDX3456900.1 TetR family transcriptional regulator [Streptomyces sp. ME02-8801-2C]
MTAAAHPSPLADRPRPGLRERKKIRTRTAIRTATYELIERHGYDATTIEQIAERAEVSQSTVFRYFPTKEDIVLTDEYDASLEEDLRARPADEPWLDSLRYVLKRAVGAGSDEEPEVTRLRSRLMLEVPAVRSRMLESMSKTGRQLCRVIADRTDRDPTDLEIRVYAMSLIGALSEVHTYWAQNNYRDNLPDLVDRTLNVFDRGLPGL